MEQKIGVEMKIREGCMKLVTACSQGGAASDDARAMEASKGLLVSHLRMEALVAELQRRRPAPRRK